MWILYSRIFFNSTEKLVFVTVLIMAMIPPPVVTEVMKVYSYNEDLNEKEHFTSKDESDISKDISKCNDENAAHNQKDEERNIEENLRDTISSSGDSHEKVENKDTLVNNSCPIDGIDLNEKTRKEHELRINDTCDDNDGDDTTKKISKKFLNLVDTDSEEETTLYETLNKESFSADDERHSGSPERLQIVNHKKNLKNKSVRRIIDSESEEDIQTSNINGFSQTYTIINSYQDLIDSESEEEKEIVHSSLIAFEESGTSESKDAKKKFVKKRKSSIRASKDEAMRQIHSETQRLLRQTEISLPYHRPKQRTLQEFLNRKKISTALPKASSTAAKLKMSSVIVSQVLAEKEKEAELFYKSSDSEDDMEQPVSFVNKDITRTMNEEMSLTDVKHTCVKDFENVRINNQISHGEGEIVQDHPDLNTVKISCGKESPLIKDSSNQDNGSDTLPQQIADEHKQKLQKFGVSRKLFDTCSKNITSKISDINHDAQEIAKQVIKTTIISSDKEKCIDNKINPEINITDNHMLKISHEHQCDSGVINEDRDKNLTTEAKISQSSGNVDNEIIETLRKDNYMTDNVVTSINSNDCIAIKDGNIKREGNCIKMDDISSFSPILIIDTQSEFQDNSLAEECEKSNGHVLGLPLPKFTNETLINRKKLLSTSIQDSKITLKGSPGMIIDLTDDAKPNGKGVDTLLDRFFYKHVVNTKKQTDNKPEVTVIHLKDTKNGLLPIKEVLPYKLPLDIDNSELSKPGAKLMRLKEDLRLKMILKRNKEWKDKEMESQVQEKEERDGKEQSDYDSDGQEKDNYFELIDSEESEPEENDVRITDKKRNKCLFADDEAEVTDDEGTNTNTEDNESDTDQAKQSKQSTNFKYRKEHMDDDISEIGTDQEEEEDEGDLEAERNIENGSESDFKDDNTDICKNFNIVKNKKDKQTKQLIEGFQDDSITNSSYSGKDNNKLKHTMADTNTSKRHCEDNDWMSENESDMPVYQQHAEATTRSQICKTPLTKTSMLDFISPITQLSVLNATLDSNKKNSLEKREYLNDNHESVSMESTQSDESSERTYNRNKNVLKKKLFDDVGENIDDEYLMQLCSGKFESTQRTDLDLFSQSNTELSELRPGNIRTQLENEISRNAKLTLNEDSHNSVNHTSELKEISAITPELKLRIVSSDDEDEADTFLKPKKRSAKRLNLSDSEEETHSSDEENNDTDNEEADERYVDYDSEENEVIVVPGKDIKKVAAGFLEEEAELSESDWDSADEDERDLDKLEFEEADDEHIDEHEVKDQLEKIHVKQILDEDKREVRLLKELLFEDGDLHTDGTGRERKFKWKNIDKLGNHIEMPQASDENDGWVDVQEDEEEAKWSKLKHERDKFLEERMKRSSDEIEDELCDSQIFKFGLNALRKIKDNEPQKQDSSLDKTDSSENMEPIMPRNITDLLNGPNTGKKSQTIYNVIKRRSLLTRGEESLARIASLAKQGDSVSHIVNTRNFVFQYIEPCTDSTSKKESEIRREEEKDQASQTKPRKRKMSDFSLTLKKRRK